MTGEEKARDLRKQIGSAIADPGATQGYKGERTLTEWQVDAVMPIVLAALQGPSSGEGDSCEKCDDSGYIESVGGGIWTGENVTTTRSICDCACGDDVRRELAGHPTPAAATGGDEGQLRIAIWNVLRKEGMSDTRCYRLINSVIENLATLSPPSDPDVWQPIETAPYKTVVRVRVGDMTFLARLEPGASMSDLDTSCDQWQAAVEGQHPPCWSGGCCWESNEDGTMSLQPEAWQPAPPARTGKEA
ncbi:MULTISPECIES: hypothetical protein [unclassified Sphingomonas]|uniref:hypothetical protein n=1 Tax=unclassified Sphingomonas TaxID=196159 RepID=UPI0006FAE59B|nr:MULTISPECIES: hypothetical protein [unclassified Sphingomonas]KQX18371.1 hypothetical protein ASD17_14515 [Sphingomonas sp. Root1294]KQY72304.1 hypothetical protein ASD39_20460 [Sphingomonas sp. Root50]KRB94425.1 hypothetical protein ASE22_00290 [Sphingomonas sp. Root720]